MFKKKVVNNTVDLDNGFVKSSRDFETTPQEEMLNKVCALYVNEFNYWRNNRLAKAVYDIDVKSYLNLNKQQAALQIRNRLQTRFPQLSWHILKAWKYVNWLLDDTYTWYK